MAPYSLPQPDVIPMLYSIDDTKKPITAIPHDNDYRRWRAKLTNSEYAAIEAELERRLAGGEILTSSWVAGNDWRGTPFDPIYSKACDMDPSQAGLFFGLIVWVFMQNHPGDWSFGRYEKNGVEIRGLTYFQITR
jgi:hypothetical protein